MTVEEAIEIWKKNKKPLSKKGYGKIYPQAQEKISNFKGS